MANRIARALGAAATLTLLAGACSSTGNATSAASGDAPQELTIALPAVSAPYTASNQSNAALRVTSNVFDPLVFWDQESGEFTPGIATSWEQVSDTEMDLKIRQGVTFHDGSPLTAEDVAFTLSEERLWGEEPLEPSPLASTFASVEVIDEETVRITTTAPDPAMLERLASPIGFVVPKSYIEEVGIETFGTAPIGTGPYKVDEVANGERVELSENTDYWGGDVPYDSLTFTEVAEVSSRVSGLATGEYDIAANLPPDQIPTVEANGQTIESVSVNNMVMLAFITSNPDSPAADPKVRQAMELAIDRGSLVESLWSGEANVPDGFNLPVYQGFYDESSTAAGQDLEAAKQLISESSYSGEPIKIQYISGYYTNFDRAMEVMVPMWAEAGITVEAEGVADYTLLDYETSHAYATSSNIALTDPISPMWSDWVGPDSVYMSNERGSLSPELTAATEEMATTLDEETRTAAFTEAQELWDAELPAFPVWQPTDIYGVGDGIELEADARYWLRMAEVPQS